MGRGTSVLLIVSAHLNTLKSATKALLLWLGGCTDAEVANLIQGNLYLNKSHRSRIPGNGGQAPKEGETGNLDNPSRRAADHPVSGKLPDEPPEVPGYFS